MNARNELGAHLAAAIKGFRLGMEGQANERFSQLLGHLEQVLPGLPPQHLNQLTALLPEVLAAQTCQDYLNIADILEYRLAPLLNYNQEDRVPLL